jgi:hypothetical protein
MGDSMQVGNFLDNFKSAKFIISDKHGAHDWVCTAMMGKPLPLPDSLLRLVPAFRDMVAEDLPACCIKIPYRIVRLGGEVVHHIPAVYHGQKNFADELRKHNKTLRLGDKWCDPSSAVDLGLSLIALLNPDSMSDLQSSLLPIRCC